MKKRKQESAPLLPVNNNNNVHVKTFYLDDIPEDEEEVENRQIFEDFIGNKTHGTDILMGDMCVMMVEVIQLFAIIQSLALRWIWPESYLTKTNFILLLNFDAWSYDKINFGAFRHVQGYYTQTAEMSFSYMYLLIGWSVVCIALILVYVAVYIAIRKVRHSYMYLQEAWLQRVAIIMIQVLSLPVGTAFIRTFHLTAENKVDINNDIEAFSSTHLAMIIPLGLFLLVLFIAFPTFLILKTNRQVIGKTTDRHEGYLQLKEMENSIGLDMIWTVRNFHIFASYKLHSRHFRAFFHIFKFLFLIMFAGLYNHMLAQTVVLTVLLGLALLTTVVMTPYRVTAFNIILVFSFAVLASDTTFSAVFTAFNPGNIQSSWLITPHSDWILALLNGFLVFIWVVFIIYVLSRQFCLRSLRSRSPLWPSMINSGILRLTPQTRTYVRAILNGRQLLERTQSTPTILAPSHELAFEIERINAYCREAECSRDAIHDSLWDLLDELIEVHAHVTPKSLFTVSVKSSVRRTAAEFVSLVPSLVKRLHQREYDFILTHPTRRRILFKLFVLATFLDTRSRRVAKKRAEMEALNKLVDPMHDMILNRAVMPGDLLYPVTQYGPLCRPDPTHIRHDLVDPADVTYLHHDMSDMFSLWMKEVQHLPQTMGGSKQKIVEINEQPSEEYNTFQDETDVNFGDSVNETGVTEIDSHNVTTVTNDTVVTADPDPNKVTMATNDDLVLSDVGDEHGTDSVV